VREEIEGRFKEGVGVTERILKSSYEGVCKAGRQI